MAFISKVRKPFNKLYKNCGKEIDADSKFCSHRGMNAQRIIDERDKHALKSVLMDYRKKYFAELLWKIHCVSSNPERYSRYSTALPARRNGAVWLGLHPGT